MVHGVGCFVIWIYVRDLLQTPSNNVPAVVRHVIAEAVDGLEANPVVRAQGTGVSL